MNNNNNNRDAYLSIPTLSVSSYSAPSSPLHTPRNDKESKNVLEVVKEDVKYEKTSHELVGHLIMIRKDGLYGAKVPINRNKPKFIFGSSKESDIRIQISSVASHNTQLEISDNGQVWIEHLGGATTTVDGRIIQHKNIVPHGSEICVATRGFRFEYINELAQKFSKQISPKKKRRGHRRGASSQHFESNLKEKRRRNRERVLREIIDTERTYVESLNILCTHFVKPLKEMALNGTFKSAQIDMLFGNIESIYSFHILFFEEISKPENFSVNACAMTFLRFSDYLKIYTAYVKGYKHMLKAIGILKQQKKFMNFLGEKKKLPECKNLDLMSYLIMPVQRIPRYELLLVELSKYAEPDSTPKSIVARSNPPSPRPNTFGKASKLSRQASNKNLSPLDTAAIEELQLATSITVGHLLNIEIKPVSSSERHSISSTSSSPSSSRRESKSNTKIPPIPPSDSAISFKAYQVNTKRASIVEANGPVARLQLAITKIKEIAKYVNESHISIEILTFEVIKRNKINKNTPRTLILDAAQRLLFIEKTDKSTGVRFRDFHLTPDQMVSCKLSSDASDKCLILEFFKSPNRLLRQAKEWILEFDSEGDRERFYRLMQIHMLPHGTSTQIYTPKPIRISEIVQEKVTRLPLQRLAEDIHNEWLEDHLSMGWRYGPIQDNLLKTSPDLLHYSDLDDEDKKMNINRVTETISCVFQLGFKIQLSVKKEKQVTLDPELFQLMEYLAENTHESWADQKLKSGWKYGPKLNTEYKEHPLLVPYCDIPDYEQESSRETAKKVIFGLLDLGYRIEKDPLFSRKASLTE